MSSVFKEEGMKGINGTEISPGDSVAFMTVSTGYAQLREGIYLGHVNGSARVTYEVKIFDFYNQDGSAHDYNVEGRRWVGFDTDTGLPAYKNSTTGLELERRARHVSETTSLTNSQMIKINV